MSRKKVFALTNIAQKTAQLWQRYRCGPCQRIAPIYEQYAAEFPEVAFYKCDVDECQVRVCDGSGPRAPNGFPPTYGAGAVQRPAPHGTCVDTGKPPRGKLLVPSAQPFTMHVDVDLGLGLARLTGDAQAVGCMSPPRCTISNCAQPAGSYHPTVPVPSHPVPPAHTNFHCRRWGL